MTEEMYFRDNSSRGQSTPLKIEIGNYEISMAGDNSCSESNILFRLELCRYLDFLARDFKTVFEATLSGGNFYADEITKETFRSSTEQRLTLHAQDGIIRGWDSVEVETNPIDERRFTVRGRIDPRFPLNGVDFRFSIP